MMLEQMRLQAKCKNTSVLTLLAKYCNLFASIGSARMCAQVNGKSG
jgi:hypothetical protein